MDLDPLPSKLELELLRNQVLRFTMDENGSNILICMLQKRDPEMIQMMLSETIKRITELMVHPIASLFVGKLIEVCNGDQWLRVLDRIILNSRHLGLICHNNYGANVVQKMLERLTQFLIQYPGMQGKFLHTHIFRFLQAFVASASIIRLARDTNAHHLLKYCLKNFPVKSIELLLSEVEYNWLAFATDKTGCYILQQCVDKSVGVFRDRLLSNIITHASELARDPYGNYVVQHVLQLNDELGPHIVNQLRGSFASLSFDRFASHLVKQCLIQIDQANLIISELLESPSLSRLIFDPYGNSVVLVALYVSEVTRFNNYECLKMRVTSSLEAKKDDISCLDIIEKFERVLSMSLLMH